MSRSIALAAFLLAMLALATPAHGQEAPVGALIPDGVTIDGVPVGGMAAAQAVAVVQATFDRPLLLRFRTRSWQATPRQLGARAYVDGAVARALRAPPGSAVDMVVHVKGKNVRTYAAYLGEVFSRPAVDTVVRLVQLRPRFTKPVTGIEVDEPALVKLLLRALNAGAREPLEVPAAELEPGRTPANYGPVIVIRRESKRLYFYRGTKLVRKFGVATGQSSYPTPIGNFSIVLLQRNPWWIPPPDSDWAQGAEPIPPGPGNPLGTRWMGLSAPLVGIHGTPDAASIGYSASHGCIRMLIPDAEWLFEQVELGTPVFIRAV